MTLENLKQFNNQRGASLIGMAILLICLGVFITGGIYLYQNYHTVVAEQTTKDHKRIIEQALQDYKNREGRLPGPAGLRIAIDDTDFGVELMAANAALGVYPMNGHSDGGGTGSDVLVGAVPVRTLEIADENMFDGYYKRFVYAVTEDLTDLALIDNIDHDMGAIRLTNPGDDDLRQAPNSLAYVIFSPGDDDRGAFSREGEPLSPCGAATVGGDLAAGSNCQFLVAGNDATFVTTVQRSDLQATQFDHTFSYSTNQVAYSWNIEPWSTCSGVCGPGQGTQNRIVRCVDHSGNEPLDDPTTPAPNDGGEHLCLAHTPKPAENQNCDLASCQWGYTAWTQCDGVCFSGEQTRRVNCTDHAGTQLEEIDGGALETDITNADCDNFTEVPQPETRRNCVLPPCRWTTGNWGVCS